MSEETSSVLIPRSKIKQIFGCLERIEKILEGGNTER